VYGWLVVFGQCNAAPKKNVKAVGGIAGIEDDIPFCKGFNARGLPVVFRGGAM
jgi:hypothetical protein